MKMLIYNEMMVHVPLCTHKDPKKVLIISDNANALVQEVQKHEGIAYETISVDINALRDVADDGYDVIISELDNDAAILAHYNRVLNDEGLLVIKHPSLEKVDANKQMMEILGKYAKIVMPYSLGNCETALLASKAYHPTADIILHRADMLDDLAYYNCDVHPAAFAMGNNIRKTYLGIIKN